MFKSCSLLEVFRYMLGYQSLYSVSIVFIFIFNISSHILLERPTTDFLWCLYDDFLDCRYLINKIQPKEKHRFHFFNSFFFRKLVDLDKDPLSSAEGRAAFLRVRKWTRKVNIFEKDYLFIPVNYK